MSTVGNNIKILREEKGITQRQLAIMLNMSYKTISHWESGYTEPSLSAIKALKEVFDVSYDDLLDKI